MCELTKEIRNKKFTGFKLAFKDGKNGKYYSLAMGTEYVIGAVRIPKKQVRIDLEFNDNILLEDEYNGFHQHMVGRTAVYTKASYIRERREHWIEKKGKVVALKMTIGKELMKGTYGSDDVIAGKEIISMKEARIKV